MDTERHQPACDDLTSEEFKELDPELRIALDGKSFKWRILDRQRETHQKKNFFASKKTFLKNQKKLFSQSKNFFASKKTFSTSLQASLGESGDFVPIKKNFQY